jgi:hypothetical protein
MVVKLTMHSHLIPRLGTNGAVILLSLYALVARTRTRQADYVLKIVPYNVFYEYMGYMTNHDKVN